MQLDTEAAGMDAGRLRRIDDHLQQRYVDAGKIAGCAVAVVRHGALAHCALLGLGDRERGRPVTSDTIWRAYSMTKPLTGVALMTLYERGLFHLDDPVARFVPAWSDIRVAEDGPDGMRLVAPRRPPTVRHLLTHTSGLGYTDDNGDISTDDLRAPRRRWPGGRFPSLAVMAQRLAEAPLAFHPGTRWRYSFATDVCARLVEVLSGRSFDEYLRTEVLDPLGMVDTGFWVPDADVDRFAANYTRDAARRLVLLEDPYESDYRTPPPFLSGGGGLVTTLPDYLRFARMLLGAGALGSTRVLARPTVELMTRNHLPGGSDLAHLAMPGGYGEVGTAGVGFGLTVAVGLGPAATGVVGPAGSFSWGGAASTTFWVDPVEDLAVVFMTQLMPSGTFNFRDQLRALVYQAIAD
jgi:CubicO group peptidase (beta-lactamase class C family)